MENGLEGDRVVVKEIKLPPFRLRPDCPKCGYHPPMFGRKPWRFWTWFEVEGLRYCPGGKPEKEEPEIFRLFYFGSINNRCHKLMGEHIHRVCKRCSFEWFTEVKGA